MAPVVDQVPLASQHQVAAGSAQPEGEPRAVSAPPKASVLPSGNVDTVELMIEPGQCWVYAPIRPRPVNETIDITVRDSTARIRVTKAEIRRGYQQVVTREGARTYRIEPPTYREVVEKVLVRPEITRLVVVPAVFEKRDEEVTLEAAKTVLNPCAGAGTQYERSVGAVAFCASEVPAKTTTIQVTKLVTPETTRVAFEPAQYKEVRRWVVDKPARAVEVDLQPELARLPLQEVAKPETSSVEELPAETREFQVTRFEGTARVAPRQAVCAADIQSDLVTRLQQRLAEKGHDPGRIDGRLGRRTVAALTDYQTENGLAVGALTHESLKHLGLDW